MTALNLEKYGREGGMRFAKKEDIPAIMSFIRDYWSEKHILANDREIFDFQYVYGDEVCFVLDMDENDEINALLGYIPYGTGEERDIFTAIWKAKKSSGFMQGMELILFLEKYGRCKNLYCVGLADKVVSMMRYMRKRIVDYSHYYYKNPNIPEEALKIGRNLKEAAEASDKAVQLKTIGSFEEYLELTGVISAETENFPSKTYEFIKRRYFEHPEYVYDKWYVCYEDKEALLIGRRQEAEGTAVYRIVDVLGNYEALSGISELIKKLFETESYEYADCLVCGLPEGILEKAGFINKAEDSIVPNYFEPFERKNVVIHNFHSKQIPAVMFKADGDQDRPSIRKKKVTGL